MSSRRTQKSLFKIFQRGSLPTTGDLYIESTEKKPRKSTSSEGGTSPTRQELFTTAEVTLREHNYGSKSSTLPKTYRSAAVLPLPPPAPSRTLENPKPRKPPPAVPVPYSGGSSRVPPRRSQSMKPTSSAVSHEYSRPFSWLLQEDEDQADRSSIPKVECETEREYTADPDQLQGYTSFERCPGPRTSSQLHRPVKPPRPAHLKRDANHERYMSLIDVRSRLRDDGKEQYMSLQQTSRQAPRPFLPTPSPRSSMPLPSPPLQQNRNSFTSLLTSKDAGSQPSSASTASPTSPPPLPPRERRNTITTITIDETQSMEV